MSYEMFALAHMEPEQSKTGKFMTLSIMVHAGLLAAAVFVTVPMVEKAKTETITIEVIEPEPMKTIARGQTVPVVTEGAMAAPANHDDVFVPAATTAQMKAEKAAAKSVHAKPAKAQAAKAIPARTAAKTAKAAGSTVAAPKAAINAAPKVATIDDIDAPEIDQAMNEAEHATSAGASLDQDFAEQDFSHIDQAQEERVSNEKSKLIADAQSVEEENENALANIQDETREEAEALNQANRDRRAQDAKAIAAAAQSERDAQAKAAAQAQAAQQAAAARAAAQAQAARNKNGSGKQGAGGDNKGSQHAGATAGSQNGVRSLDQLRQMPGNRGPMYSREERRNRESGVVSFLAYVTKEGRLAKFRQVSTTGHQNLDRKTLEALQKWKFYPGQEGWVELPFKWDLHGEPQALDGLLRGRGKDISQL